MMNDFSSVLRRFAVEAVSLVRGSVARAVASSVGPARAAATALVLMEMTMSASEADTIRVLALGDSLTSGWGLPEGAGFVSRLQAALNARGVDARVIDAGLAGDTAAGGLARLRRIPPDAFDAAIVELGVNDLLTGVPPTYLRRNLEAIVDTLQAARKPVLLAGARSPFGPAPGYEGIHAAIANARGIDLDPDFLAGAVGPGLDQGDGLHPNARGVEVTVARVLPRVLRLIETTRNQK